VAMLFAESEAHAERPHNDGFARQPACAVIHMQQRGWICSSSQEPMQTLAQTLWHLRLRQPYEMQRKGWLRALDLQLEFMWPEGQAIQALCARRSTCARRSALLTLAPASRCSCTWT
jgi:hypothetical protein